MEALVITTSHASSRSSLTTAAGCAAADAWSDEDGFIQVSEGCRDVNITPKGDASQTL
jgi:hypothetical protein